jgi:putative ABC transport system substrate-binding protein
LWEAKGARDYETAMATVVRKSGEAVLLQPDPVYYVEVQLIQSMAAAFRLPTMSSFREVAAAGGLLAYGVNLDQHYRDAVVYVDRILRGEKPADLPVAQPTRFDFVINRATAKALALAIPQSVLLQATELID